MRQAIVVLLLLSGAVLAAPAPFAKREKVVVHPPWPTPGKYIVTWGGSENKEGELLNMHMGWYWFHGTKYYFIWEFNQGTRVFTMWESSEQYGDGFNKMHRYAKDEMSMYTFPLMQDELRTPDTYNGTKLHLKRK